MYFVGNTQIANKKALSIQQILKRRGRTLELKFGKLQFDRIKIEDAYEIKDLVLEFRALEPEYKGETVKLIAQRVGAAINIWNEVDTARQHIFYDHMEEICSLLINF